MSRVDVRPAASKTEMKAAGARVRAVSAQRLSSLPRRAYLSLLFLLFVQGAEIRASLIRPLRNQGEMTTPRNPLRQVSRSVNGTLEKRWRESRAAQAGCARGRDEGPGGERASA